MWCPASTRKKAIILGGNFGCYLNIFYHLLLQGKEGNYLAGSHNGILEIFKKYRRSDAIGNVKIITIIRIDKKIKTVIINDIGIDI